MGWEWGGRAEGGAEAKVEGVTWPLLLHTTSGHQPGSTVLQLVSARPRHPLLGPLSQMGRQTPSLPVCPAASLKTNGQKRQEKNKNKKRQTTPSVKDPGKAGEEWKKLQRSPWKSPHNWGVGWEVEPQSGVGCGQWSSDPVGGQSGLPQATSPQGKHSQEGESGLGPPSWTSSSQVHFSWDIPQACSAETRN